MNAFAAAVILSQISLHDFLALRADQRLRLVLPIPTSMMVGTIIIPYNKITNIVDKERFNAAIAQRRDDVDTLVGDGDDTY